MTRAKRYPLCRIMPTYRSGKQLASPLIGAKRALNLTHSCLRQSALEERRTVRKSLMLPVLNE